MIIKSCLIENFGNISNFSFDFKNGLNEIVEDNGWGKSTFAAFIRAMFYGLDGGGKRSITENERKRYKPWQGGVFGGRLVFEANGKEYEITRVFGDKDSADEFELRDANTNIISNDYSERIGEELFNIDRKSFMRTMFIGQGDCEAFVTDDINAKVGNITDDTNDLNNYEKAIENLTDIANALNPNRKTGSIAKRKEEIAQCQKRILDKKNIDETLDSYQKMMKEAEEEKEELKSKIKENNDLQRKASLLQKVLSKKDEYNRLCEDYDKKKEAYDRAKALFKEDAPTKALLEENINKLEMLGKLNERAAVLNFTDEDNRVLEEGRYSFRNGIPEVVDIDEKISDVTLLSELRAQIDKDSITAEEEDRYKELKNAIENNHPKKTVPVILMIIGGLLIALGIILIVSKAIALSLVCLILGIGLLVGGIVYLQSMMSAIQMDIANKSAEYMSLQKRINNAPSKETMDKADRLSKDIAEFLDEYAMDDREDRFKDTLYVLKDRCRRYKDVSLKNENLKAVRLDIKALETDLRSFVISKAEGLESEELAVAVRIIKDRVYSYYEKERDVKEAKERLDVILREYSEDELKDDNLYKDVPSLDEIHEGLSLLNEKLDKINDTILNYDNIIDGLKSQYDELEEDRELLAALEDRQLIEKEQHRLISLSKKKLEEAKQTMTLKYAGPILDSFKSYYEMIDSDKASSYHVDADINLSYDSLGKQRDIETLSEGYKDLTGIALRLALVDAMYEANAPVIIMDDPFINLDDSKIKDALVFLNEVAKKYQIIYLTCSRARVN